MFLIDTASRDSCGALGGVPNARVFQQGAVDVRVNILSVDGVTKHLEGSTGQLNYFKSFTRIILVYSKVFYPLARCLQIDQRFIPVVGDVMAELTD